MYIYILYIYIYMYIYILYAVYVHYSKGHAYDLSYIISQYMNNILIYGSVNGENIVALKILLL